MNPRSRMTRLRWIVVAMLAAIGVLAFWFAPRGGPRIEIAAADRSIDGTMPRPGALFRGGGVAVATFAEDDGVPGGGVAATGPIESVATVLGEAGNLAAPGAREAVLERLRGSEAQRLALARILRELAHNRAAIGAAGLNLQHHGVGAPLHNTRVLKRHAFVG